MKQQKKKRTYRSIPDFWGNLEHAQSVCTRSLSIFPANFSRQRAWEEQSCSSEEKIKVHFFSTSSSDNPTFTQDFSRPWLIQLFEIRSCSDNSKFQITESKWDVLIFYLMPFNIAKIDSLHIYKGSRDKTYNLTYRHTPNSLAQLKTNLWSCISLFYHIDYYNSQKVTTVTIILQGLKF